ncbi:MAG TPA: GntR family transcriptional regulator [Chloroflexota bacterium]
MEPSRNRTLRLFSGLVLIHRAQRESLAEFIRGLIKVGRLRPGDTLPSRQELARTLNISRETVYRAVALLARDGLVEMARGHRDRVVGLANRQRGPRREAHPGGVEGVGTLAEFKGLPARALNALARAGYRTRAEVARAKDSDILRHRFIGPHTLQLIRAQIPFEGTSS